MEVGWSLDFGNLSLTTPLTVLHIGGSFYSYPQGAAYKPTTTRGQDLEHLSPNHSSSTSLPLARGETWQHTKGERLRRRCKVERSGLAVQRD